MLEHLLPFVAKHWQLSLALVVIVLLIIGYELMEKRKQPKMLSTATVVEMINDDSVTLIDIRAVEDFRAGHILNSIRVAKDEFQSAKMNKYKDKPLVIVCNRGIQAAALASELSKAGFVDPMVLEGGITAWRTAQLPLVKGK